MLRVNSNVEIYFETPHTANIILKYMDTIYSILGISCFWELIGMLFNFVLGLAGILLILFCAGAVLGFLARYWWVVLIVLVGGGIIYSVVETVNFAALLTWALPVVGLIWLIVHFGVIGFIFGLLARVWPDIVVCVVLCYVAALLFGCAASIYPLIAGIVIGVLINLGDKNGKKRTTSRYAGRN